MLRDHGYKAELDQFLPLLRTFSYARTSHKRADIRVSLLLSPMRYTKTSNSAKCCWISGLRGTERHRSQGSTSTSTRRRSPCRNRPAPGSLCWHCHHTGRFLWCFWLPGVTQPLAVAGTMMLLHVKLRRDFVDTAPLGSREMRTGVHCSHTGLSGHGICPSSCSHLTW